MRFKRSRLFKLFLGPAPLLHWEYIPPKAHPKNHSKILCLGGTGMTYTDTNHFLLYV